MKHIRKFNELSINESMMNPYVGFYDMSNGSMDQLIEALENDGIQFDFDRYRNYITISTDSDFEKIQNYIIGEEFGRGCKSTNIVEMFDDPNDCVLLKVKSRVVIPPGAMI